MLKWFKYGFAWFMWNLDPFGKFQEYYDSFDEYYKDTNNVSYVESLYNVWRASGELFVVCLCYFSVIIQTTVKILGYNPVKFIVLMNISSVLSIIFCYIFSDNKDMYLYYFEQFQECPKRQNRKWHIITFFIVVIGAVAFIKLILLHPVI